jgi:bidirectional [NiFe] hydrogenase diaphorase subunit
MAAAHLHPQPWGASQTCTSCGKCVLACPTGAIVRQGAPVAEMEHDRDLLETLITARRNANNFRL